MSLQHLGFVDLPAHAGPGGFDHAAVHESTGRVYLAHTANDAVDVIDVEAGTCVESIPGLPAVAGALVAEASALAFTSNRGENTVGIFPLVERPVVERLRVGIRPNGLAHDPLRRRLLVAHVGDPTLPGSCTVSVLDVPGRRRLADLTVAGRTRWAVHDPAADAFHVNVAHPPQIVVVESGDPVQIRRIVPVPHAGPHGLGLDVERRRLFCACDAGVLLEVDADGGAVLGGEAIAGVPDVVFFDPGLRRLYVAIGDPGVIEVFDTAPLRHLERIRTEIGAHTLSLDATRSVVCSFWPESHRAAVYRDHP